jgi:hypothetical protein
MRSNNDQRLLLLLLAEWSSLLTNLAALAASDCTLGGVVGIGATRG